MPVTVKKIELAAMIDFEFEPGKPPKGLELDKLCPDQDRWLIGKDPEATRREDPDSVRKQQLLSGRPPLAGETWGSLARQASESLPPGTMSDYVAPQEHQGLAGVTDDYKARYDRLKQLREDYDISFEWLWYRPYAKSAGLSTEMSLFDQLCTVYSLPPEDKYDSMVIGLRFTVLRNRGVGVATIWVSYQESFRQSARGETTGRALAA